MKPTPLDHPGRFAPQDLVFTEDYDLEADQVDNDILEQIGYNDEDE